MSQTNRLPVPVLPGIREDVSPHFAQPGTLAAATNCRFIRDGEVQGRSGTEALAAVANTDLEYGELVTRGPDFLAAVPGGFVFGVKGFSYRYDTATESTLVGGSYGYALPERKLVTIAREELSVDPTLNGDGQPYPLSQAARNGYVAMLYSTSESTNGWMVRVTTEEGAPVMTQTLYTGVNAQAGFVVEDGSTANTVVTVMQVGAALSAQVLTLAASGSVATAFIGIGTLNAADSSWAAAYWPGLGWLLAYVSGPTTVTLRLMNGVTPITTATFTVGAAAARLNTYCDESNGYIGIGDLIGGATSVARLRVVNSTLASATGTVNIDSVASGSIVHTPVLCGPTATVGTVLTTFAVRISLGIPRMRAGRFTSAGSYTDASADGDVYGLLPLSAPFANGMIWALAVTPIGTGTYAARAMLLDYQLDRSGSVNLTNPKIALIGEEWDAAFLYAAGEYERQQVSAPRQLSTGEWVQGLPRVVRKEGVEFGGGLYGGGLALGEWYVFTLDQRRSAAPYLRTALIAGNLVAAEHPVGTWAGAGILASQAQGSDLGLILPPVFGAGAGSGAIAVTTADGALTPGLYQYRAVIEHIDSNGTRHRSAPSGVVSNTLVAPENAYELDIAYPIGVLRHFGRDDSANRDPAGTSRHVVHFYRTTANGQQFYRVTPPQGAPIVTNGTAATYTDELSDEYASRREFLYTDGGVLNNDHPPSHRYLRVTEDRVWLGGLWEGNQIQSSKIMVPGEPPQFSDLPAFRVVLPGGDDNTGLAYQDGTLFAFARRAIFAVLGLGPSDQGQGAWDTPRCITRSTGCVNSLSILETSLGVFFESERGIELLPRGGGEPVYIGEGIHRSFTGPVTGASVVTTTESHTVRFCNGTTSVFVFDLDARAWSIDQYPLAVASICDTESGAVLALVTATADGFTFLRESDALAVDADGAAAESSIASSVSWVGVHPWSIGGWGRFNNVVGMFDEMPAPATGYSATGTVSLFAQVDNAVDVGATFSAATLGSPCYREHVQRQVDGAGLRLRLTTTDTGWRFIGWTVGIDDHGGTVRLPREERG